MVEFWEPVYTIKQLHYNSLQSQMGSFFILLINQVFSNMLLCLQYTCIKQIFLFDNIFVHIIQTFTQYFIRFYSSPFKNNSHTLR